MTYPKLVENADLEFMRNLDMLGAPLFVLERAPQGTPPEKLLKGLYRAPVGWSHFTADGNSRRLDLAAPGCGYGMVCGHVYDVIDVDPRNGGDNSLITMAAESSIPKVHWAIKTPSSGWHFYIEPQGLGKRQGFMPGIDLQGVGSFVFIPPTEDYRVIPGR